MPCNSDYLEQTADERTWGQLYLVHDEVCRGQPITATAWSAAGYDKRVYNIGTPPKSIRDQLVREVCARLEAMPPMMRRDTLTLEAQLWWRDHQAADAVRLARR